MAESEVVEPGRALIRVQDVHVTLQGAKALDNVSLDLHEGEHLVVQGRNGSGKSTLLRLLRGEVFPDAGGGSVLWRTEDGFSATPLCGREMVALASPAVMELYVRQGWNLCGEDLILSGVSDGPLLYDDPGGAARERARALAGEMRMAHLLERGVGGMSQGQLCLLFLARACLARPRVLLLDEFSNGLDRQARARVMELLERVGRTSTLVITTHRKGSLPACLRREIRLEKGVMRADGPYVAAGAGARGGDAPKEAAPDGANAGTCRGTGGGARPLGPASVEALRAVAACRAQAAEPLVRIENATVFVDRVPVLHGITWTLRRGEQWMLSGGNGSGKSTLLRLLAGEEHPAAGGSIRYVMPRHGGEVRGRESLGRAVRLVSDRLQATYRYDIRGEQLVLSGFDNSIGLYRQTSDDERAEARRWMERLDAAHLATRPLRSLSTGQMRALLLARALVGEPELLLLDEPLSGLDEGARANMVGVLNELIAGGMHLVLVTHHDGDVLPVMTHEARLAQGRIVATGPRF
jgi:molybdate transport system ATP-binding protein